jgi:hypothetical protein
VADKVKSLKSQAHRSEHKPKAQANGSRGDDAEFVEHFDDAMDPDDYSDESDVFEDDLESLVYHERKREEVNGYGETMMEIPVTIRDYTYPSYIAKLPQYFTKESVFGEHPEQFIYANNLMVSARRDGVGTLNETDVLSWHEQYSTQLLDLLDKKADEIERRELERVRFEQAEAKRVAEERRRQCVLPLRWACDFAWES